MMVPLNRNERRTALMGLLVLMLWAGQVFIVKPVKSRIATLHRVIPQKQREIIDLHNSLSRYKTLQDKVARLQEQIDRQDPAFALLPQLETMLETLQLKAVQMDQRTIPLDSTYAEDVVDVVLERVTLAQIVEFIQTIEALKVPVQIRDTHVTRNPTSQERLNCALSIYHPKLAQQQG